MNEFDVVTVIGRPVEDVFAVIRDVARAPVWTPGLSEVRRTSDGPLGVGATMVYVGTFLGGGMSRRWHARVSRRASNSPRRQPGGRFISRSTSYSSRPTVTLN